MGQGQGGNSNTWGRARDAVEGEEPQRRLDRRLEEDAKAVGGRLLSVTNAIEALNDAPTFSPAQELRLVCTLCYRLLRHMVKGSPEFALELAEYIPFMQSQLGRCVLAADTLSEMFHNNRTLLEQLPERVVTYFVRLLTERMRQPSYIKFLCELCVCDDQGILKNQTVVCKRLIEENSGLLLPMKVGPAGGSLRDEFFFCFFC